MLIKSYSSIKKIKYNNKKATIPQLQHTFHSDLIYNSLVIPLLSINSVLFLNIHQSLGFSQFHSLSIIQNGKPSIYSNPGYLKNKNIYSESDLLEDEYF